MLKYQFMKIYLVNIFSCEKTYSTVTLVLVPCVHVEIIALKILEMYIRMYNYNLCWPLISLNEQNDIFLCKKVDVRMYLVYVL